MDKDQAAKLRRAARKVRKTFDTLCDETENVPANADAYLKANKTFKKLRDPVESA